MVEKKSLYRLPKQGKISGVCAGLADFFGIDVTLIRLIFVVLALITGGGVVILYIILSIILPVDNTNDTISEKVQKLGKDLNNSNVIGRMRNYFGVGLLLLGIWLLVGQLFPQWFDLRWEYVWPTLLIFIGLIIIFRRKDDGK